MKATLLMETGEIYRTNVDYEKMVLRTESPSDWFEIEHNGLKRMIRLSNVHVITEQQIEEKSV